MKSGKAAGADLIITEMIKASADSTAEPITNLILSTECYPKSWGIGIITPIHKWGSREEVDNYRGTVSSYI
jgi:hypothetical protein